MLMGRLLKKQIDNMYKMLDDGYTYKEIMSKVGCSKPTLYKYVDLRKKEKKESPCPADVVEKTDTQIIKEGFILAKDVAIFGVKLESTKKWLESITYTTEDDDSNIIGLLEQVSYLETKIDDKNITLELLKEYQGLRNDIIIDGNKIIKGINERMRREERGEMARIEREKKEEIERKKKEEEEKKQMFLKRKLERYYSYPLSERQRMILRDGGVRDHVDQDFIIMGWLRIVREEKSENRLEQFKLFLNLSEIPRANYDFIAFWWEMVCTK